MALKPLGVLPPLVIEVNRTTLIGLLAIGLTIGLSGFSGAALAEQPATTVEKGQADECSQTIETPKGEEEVTYPCDLVETEICYTVVYGPMGMPQLVPYPCNVSVNTPDSSQTASKDLICYKVVHGPMGMPQLMPWPCALQR